MDDKSRSATEEMLRHLVHRGPDQHGIWQTPSIRGAVLGHRRLSIIDTSEAGRQPMVDKTTGVAIVFNGECYNFVELRKELEQVGRRFSSGSDTEVVLAAYAEWGENAVRKMRGMFALAVWDPRNDTVLLVRDRLGIKPLYFTSAGGNLVFASELRAMLASGLTSRRIDPQALESYLWNGFVPGPHTIVRDVHLLDPGTFLRVSANGKIISSERYWSLPTEPPLKDSKAAAEYARSTLEEAVKLHLVSDVPLGIFLSGGVDSSVVTAMAARASSAKIKTFNVTFDVSEYDESSYARQVAEALGTEHHEVPLSEKVFSEQLEDAQSCIDQPTFDAINTYFVSRAVKEAGMTVALAGTGGDELFGGYSSFTDIPAARNAASLLRWLPARARSMFSQAVCRTLMGAASEFPQQTRWGKLDDVLATEGDLVALYQTSYGLFSRDMLAALQVDRQLRTDWGLSNEHASNLRSLVSNQDVEAAVSTLELANFTGERLLRDTDCASMAVSLEVRVPLLDHSVVEAVSRLPNKLRFAPLGKKEFLKNMALEQLDSGIFERKKAGFELPLNVWCKQRLSEPLQETFQDMNLAHAIGLDAETVGRLWRAFNKGGPGIYWSRVWSLFVLMNWCKRYNVYA